MNRKLTTITALSVVALFALGGMSNVLGANHQEFGTQVQIGDSDFIPVLDRVWAEAGGNICFLDFGETNVQDFGFYLRPDAETAGNLERFAIRLTESQGHAAGTLVQSSHTAEQNQACTSTGDMEFKYGDVNNNGRYDGGDYVWLTTSTADDDLDASASGTQVTIRLTETNGGAAGTLVFAQDADYTSYGSGNAENAIHANSRFGFFNADRSGGTGASSTFTTGDQMYLAIAEPGVDGDLPTPANGNLVPMHSLRLHSDVGAYGSQVAVEDDDFIPLLNEIALDAAAFDNVCIVDFGGQGNVNDMGFYLNPHATTATVAAGYIRLRGPDGTDAGTRVGGTDTSEVGESCTSDTYTIHVADRNNNGRYDEGDWVFITSAATAPGADMDASSSASSWTVRLTETDSGAAGTLVFAGDSDYQSWGSNTIALPGGADYTDNWGIFDQDRSGVRGDGEIFTAGDSIYLTNGDAPTAGLVEVYSVRIISDIGDFGTQVTFGDEDFIPTLGMNPTTRICVVPLGDGQNVDEFGFYLYFGAAQTSVQTNFVRLKAVEGNEPGSVVQHGDTTERGQACADTIITFSHLWTDRNNNGRYDDGDDWYIAYNAGGAVGSLVASSDEDTWTLRMTDVQDFGPGTLVFNGDSDLVSFGGSATNATAANIRLFDEDRSNSFTGGDSVYVQPAATAGLNLVQLYAIRVTGSLPTSTPPPSPPTGDGDGTTPPPADDDGTDDGNVTPPPTDDDDTTTPPPADGDDDTATPPPADDDDAADETPEPTPGFGLVAILAAFGLMAVALRRRR